MKTVIKTVIAGAVIAAVGLIALIAGLALNGWRLDNVKFTMRSFTAENENADISVRIDMGSVRTEFYDGDRVIIDYPVADGYSTSISEEGGKIAFRGLHNSGWHFLQFGKLNVPDTVIKLPEGVVFDVAVKLNAGSARLCDGRFGKIKIDLDAGTMQCGNLICETLSLNLDAGTVKIAAAECGSFDCDLDAGAAAIDKLDCAASSIKLDAGAVKIGYTGAQEEYSIITKINAGSCNVAAQTGTSGKTINIRLDAGSAKLTFGA